MFKNFGKDFKLWQIAFKITLSEFQTQKGLFMFIHRYFQKFRRNFIRCSFGTECLIIDFTYRSYGTKINGM